MTARDGSLGSADLLVQALSGQSHRRRNALTGRWVLVSSHRTLRPWSGQHEAAGREARPDYDPACYLCPGNTRADGTRNPVYENTFVFANDFPALTKPRHVASVGNDLFAAAAVGGECRVICYSPRHDLSLGDLPPPAAIEVVRCWRREFRALDEQPDMAYAVIFENRGELMGASNPHPHGQVWATSTLPDEVVDELAHQRAYYERHGRPLLVDYLQAEQREGTRLVHQNANWVALVPFWAVWPFELMVLPRRPIPGFESMTPEEEVSLAAILQSVIVTYDRLFDVQFAYSMGWHPRPAGPWTHPEWVLHAHFYPPLLRSAHVRKFQVGFELLGMPQRDLTPEAAAEKLRVVVR